MNFYLTLKALHLIAVISWMAGLLYLPRIFVYHEENKNDKSSSNIFKVMERKLYYYIMMPAMLLSWFFGLLLIGNIGPGAGEGSRLAVGATIFGGMLISTFFTLYVTPTMYVLLTKNTKRIDVIDIQLSKELKR